MRLVLGVSAVVWSSSVGHALKRSEAAPKLENELMDDLRFAVAGAAAWDPRPRARAPRARRATGSRWRRAILPCRVLAPCPVVGGQRRPRDARNWRRRMGSADIERLPGGFSQRLRAVACGTAPPVSCRALHSAAAAETDAVSCSSLASARAPTSDGAGPLTAKRP